MRPGMTVSGLSGDVYIKRSVGNIEEGLQSAANKETIMGATFLVCHGAWSAGWTWKKMHPLMAAAGHRLVTPTYTGLGERAHLANPSIDLETHIRDILNVVKYEDLRDIVLVGHSYGGMVATGVADRTPRPRHATDLHRRLRAGRRPVSARSERDGAATHAGTR